MKLEIFLAALAIAAAWLQYRINIINERERILKSLSALLDVVGKWAGASYSTNYNDRNWFDPGRSVYKIDVSIVPNIISSSLIEKELSSLLTYFVELICRLNQRIDTYDQFIYSDVNLFLKASSLFDKKLQYLNYEDCYYEIEKLKNTEDEKDSILHDYIDKVYRLNKIVHVDGIGDNRYYIDKFPTLHKCFLELGCELKNEESKKRSILYDKFTYFIGDLVFLMIPSIIIFAYILYSADRFMDCIINLCR
jgi:hypothetical protein